MRNGAVETIQECLVGEGGKLAVECVMPAGLRLVLQVRDEFALLIRFDQVSGFERNGLLGNLDLRFEIADARAGALAEIGVGSEIGAGLGRDRSGGGGELVVAGFERDTDFGETRGGGGETRFLQSDLDLAPAEHMVEREREGLHGSIWARAPIWRVVSSTRVVSVGCCRRKRSISLRERMTASSFGLDPET